MASEHHHLYNLAAWKRLRLAHLRMHPWCRICEEMGSFELAAVVDHIKPHKGDMELFLDPDNLQSLSKACHDRHKQAQERNADGIMRGAGLSGAPIDKAHPWFKPAVGGVEKSAAHQTKT
ncbi:MAG: hypothetical protein RL375_4842, partial [Pseudomonadota bacterium]